MTFDEYQKLALTTAIVHPDPAMDKSILAMGLAGEAGEVVDKWKKIVAYHDGVVTPEDLVDFTKEMGDTLWYIALFAERLGLSFDTIAKTNLHKLADRKQRDVIRGAGDNR
ncbi:MAG TPA: nucleoside triphosphate pyrophosphohydrolase family protein [Candidatus Saccharimonadales bacterium]|jgi:NTP pyrophosphatase (non-canonical NTP hydrolase)|nr:nucleoside triphosphate pyrophosphohydrolase family protein [Candidatus Saccharimonadales bacterium]